ncbi:MAG: class II glutamine amidotransferase [Thermoplasmataceae archaeon]
MAQHDPLLESGSELLPSHPDGWGYANLSDGDLAFWKSNLPVYESPIPVIKNGILMMHARKASPGEPKGLFSSHPYHGTTQEIEIFMAHNGAFEKKGIAKRLGISDCSNITDSELFLHLVLSKGGSLSERVSRSIDEIRDDDLLKGTPNLLFIGIDRNRKEPEVLYYTDSASNEQYVEYNKLYRIDQGNWSGIFSSSILKSEYFPEGYPAKEVKRNSITYL